MNPVLRQLTRLAALLALSLLALQLYFALRVASMAIVDPQSTTFQRSEAWRLAFGDRRADWQQRWVGYTAISAHLKRAVIASEDAGFTEHSGVEWDAIERAWERNLRAEARAERTNELLERHEARRAARGAVVKAATRAEAKLVGGSTITQQLAKNLFLDGERSLARKGQEFVITLLLEGLLDKQRILEIYLNNVEWGEGLFGAQAAAQHYFGVDAAHLGTMQAARLAVMLPAPKRFQRRPGSAYVEGRAATIAARMVAVELP
jgi:monofunctional biosynthetic peptidoglycan transglycosylase